MLLLLFGSLVFDILCHYCISCVLMCAQIMPSIFASSLGAAEMRAASVAAVSHHGDLINAVVLILP